MGISGFFGIQSFYDGGSRAFPCWLPTFLVFPFPRYCRYQYPVYCTGLPQDRLEVCFENGPGYFSTGACLAFIPFPDVTPDKLLSALFGGFFYRTGIGLAMRGGAVLDGTEIAALLLSINSPIIKVSDAILLMNV